MDDIKVIRRQDGNEITYIVGKTESLGPTVEVKDGECKIYAVGIEVYDEAIRRGIKPTSTTSRDDIMRRLPDHYRALQLHETLDIVGSGK